MAASKTRTTMVAVASMLAMAGTAVPASAAPAEDDPPTTAADSALVGSDGDDTFALKTITAFDWTTMSMRTAPGIVRTTAGGTPAPVTEFLPTGAFGVDGGAGDDTFTVDPSLTYLGPVNFVGGPGDDVIDAGQLRNVTLVGGPGTNTLLGGPGDDEIRSSSSTDTIDGRGGHDRIIDAEGPRSGGRTIANTASKLTYALEVGGDLGTVSIGTASDGSVGFSASGNRPGYTKLPALEALEVRKSAADAPNDLTLVNITIPTQTRLTLRGSPGGRDLADITVPTGTWVRNDESGATYVIPQTEGLNQVVALDFDAVSVHAPFTNHDEQFVHRVVRDLLFTFIDDAGRTERAAALQAGTLTRAGLVDEIMGLDAYRGNDVERTFLKYLHRAADPSGKAYWIDALAAGRPLWRFRAQLVGSNEYFTKAGGTNAAYLTRAYNDVLGRNPDPSGLAYWTKKLDAGTERGLVALQFINAAETRRRLVDDQYLRFYGALPTWTEREAGAARLLQPDGEQQLIRSLLISWDYVPA